MRKSFFGGCIAIENGKRLENSDLGRRGIVQSM